MGQHQGYVQVIGSSIIYSLHKNTFQTSILQFCFNLYLTVIILVIILLSGCTSSKRYGEEEKKDIIVKTAETEETSKSSSNSIRILLDEMESASFLTIQNTVNVYDEKNKIAVVNPGNTLEFYDSENQLLLKVRDQSFSGNLFKVQSDNSDYITYNGKNYKGMLSIHPSENSIEIVNNLDIEEYLKGVISREMPLGKGTENLEALKALAICARTYSMIRIKESKTLYDLYPDTRDQVYGGIDAEYPLSNQAVDDTKDMILTYNDSLAQLFYHSTCGGFTEDAINVFTDTKLEYLKGIQDGDPPYCSISPRFEWTEIFTEDLIIDRLKSAALISHTNYSLEDLVILSRFDSGRVNELQVVLNDDYNNETSISIFGNDIRQVLKNADGKLILWSSVFDISRDDQSIILNGKGFGHGVGMCQWGAISLSKRGWNFEDILQHYYPGTQLGSADD